MCSASASQADHKLENLQIDLKATLMSALDIHRNFVEGPSAASESTAARDLKRKIDELGADTKLNVARVKASLDPDEVALLQKALQSAESNDRTLFATSGPEEQAWYQKYIEADCVLIEAFAES